LDPEIEHVVKVDVREQRTDLAANRVENFVWRSRVARSALRARMVDGRKKR